MMKTQQRHSLIHSASLVSLRPALSNGLSNGYSNYSSTLTNHKAWIKLQVDNIKYDFKNDQYEITIQDGLLLAFDHLTRTFVIKMSSSRCEVDKNVVNNDDGNINEAEFNSMFAEVENADIKLKNIIKDWKKLQSNILTNTLKNLSPKNSLDNKHKHITKSHHHHHHKHKVCSKTIQSCPHIQRITFILKYYNLYLSYKIRDKHILLDDNDNDNDNKSVSGVSGGGATPTTGIANNVININDRYPISMLEILSILNDYNTKAIINDYLHIKSNHYDDDQYELTKYIKSISRPLCDNNEIKCHSCNRNKENSEIYKNLSSKNRRDLYLIDENIKELSVNELKEINIQQYLDTIHSTLIHQTLSISMNNKFTTCINKDDNNINGIIPPLTPFVLMNDDKKSNIFGASNSSISNNSNSNSDTDDFTGSGTINNQYDLSILQSVTSDTEYDDIDMASVTATKTIITTTTTTTKHKNKSNSASFIQLNNNNKYKFGEHYTYWNPKFKDYVKPKYLNLKVELLSNTICRLNQNDYQLLYDKTLDFLQSNNGKIMNCKRQFSWMYKSVKYGSKITINHIVSLILYTTYMEYRSTLINIGMKKINHSETYKESALRNSEISYWCRFLKETIFCFGDALTDRSRLYHGIDCKIMFNSTNFNFNIPISTTSKYSLAPNTSSSGICLKLGKPILSHQKNYSFDVSNHFLTKFPDEKERIIYGGEALGLTDIIYNGQSHSEHILSLRLYQQIIEGNWFGSLNKDIMKIKYQRRILKLMNSIMNQNYSNYMVGFFKNLATINLRHNTMWVNKLECNKLIPELRQLFFNKFQPHLIKHYSLNIRYCDILSMTISKQDIDMSSFRKSIYSQLYTYNLNNTEKVSFIFRCFKKFDEVRKENMFRGFIAIKYLPKSNSINAIDMRYGIYFPQKQLAKWDDCVLGPSCLYKGSSLFSLSEVKNINTLQIKICFQIRRIS